LNTSTSLGNPLRRALTASLRDDVAIMFLAIISFFQTGTRHNTAGHAPQYAAPNPHTPENAKRPTTSVSAAFGGPLGQYQNHSGGFFRVSVPVFSVHQGSVCACGRFAVSLRVLSCSGTE